MIVMTVIVITCLFPLVLSVPSSRHIQLTLSDTHTRPFFSFFTVSVFCLLQWFGEICLGIDGKRLDLFDCSFFRCSFDDNRGSISSICSRYYYFHHHHNYCYYSSSLFLSNPLLQISSLFIPCAPSEQSKTLFQRSVLFFKVWFKHGIKGRFGPKWVEVHTILSIILSKGR